VKKLLGILVLGLLFTSSAFAKKPGLPYYFISYTFIVIE